MIHILAFASLVLAVNAQANPLRAFLTQRLMAQIYGHSSISGLLRRSGSPLSSVRNSTYSRWHDIDEHLYFFDRIDEAALGHIERLDHEASAHHFVARMRTSELQMLVDRIDQAAGRIRAEGELFTDTNSVFTDLLRPTLSRGPQPFLRFPAAHTETLPWEIEMLMTRSRPPGPIERIPVVYQGRPRRLRTVLSQPFLNWAKVHPELLPHWREIDSFFPKASWKRFAGRADGGIQYFRGPGIAAEGSRWNVVIREGEVRIGITPEGLAHSPFNRDIEGLIATAKQTAEETRAFSHNSLFSIEFLDLGRLVRLQLGRPFTRNKLEIVIREQRAAGDVRFDPNRGESWLFLKLLDEKVFGTSRIASAATASWF